MDTPIAATEAPGVPPVTDPLDDWLDRVTRRLSVDRELQWEVRLELRSHLQDSIAELRRAGRSETDARDEAVRALGDEVELADQLWRANRRRVRLRAVAVWAARLILPPAAVTLAVVLAVGGLTSWAILEGFMSRSGPSFLGGQWLLSRGENAVMAKSSPQVRGLFEQNALPLEGQTVKAKALLDANPADLALYANYAGAAVRRPMFSSLPEPPDASDRAPDFAAIDETAEESRPIKLVLVVDEPVFKETLDILAEGERREPDNALYPLITASLLFQASSYEDYGTSDTIERPGRKTPDGWSPLAVPNPARFAEAKAAYHRAAGKPYFRSYAAELLRRRVDAMPDRRLPDLLLRGRAEIATGIHFMADVRTAPTRALTAAVTDAAAGRVDDAMTAVADARALARKLAADAEGVYDAFNAIGLEGQADTIEARIRFKRGDIAAADALWARYDAAADRMKKLRDEAMANVSGGGIQSLGILDRIMWSAWLRPDRIDVGHMRRAEYAVFDQLGVAAISTALLVLAGVYALVAGARWLLSPPGGRPPRLTIGWRLTVKVVVLGAALPVALYFLYARFTPLGGRARGLGDAYMLARVGIEYGILLLTIVITVGVLARRAVRARMAELHVKPGPAVRPDWLTAGAVLVTVSVVSAALCLTVAATVAMGVYSIADRLPKRIAQNVASPAILTAWILIALAATWLSTRLRAPRTVAGVTAAAGAIGARMNGWVARASVPVLLLAAVVIGLAGLPLRRAESRAVAAAAADRQPVVYLGFVERSVLSDLRDELLKR